MIIKTYLQIFFKLSECFQSYSKKHNGSMYTENHNKKCLIFFFTADKNEWKEYKFQ